MPRRLQVQETTLLTGPLFVGFGAGAGWDLGPRLDVTVSGVAGNRSGAMRVRLEGVFAFHLNFPAQQGWGFYGGGGLAAHTGPDSGQYLVIKAGIERNDRRGPFVEAGAGGGAFVSGGLRLQLR